MLAEQKKYIDLNQLPHKSDGTISWKDSVGVKIEFFYNDKRHILEILEYDRTQKKHLKVKIDKAMSQHMVDI